MARSKSAAKRPIVLQLRAGSASPVALEAALKLARVLHSDFESIFVEDDELLSLAELPFAREITATGRRSRPLRAETVMREMRAASNAAQRKIEALARDLDITTRFSVVRDAPEQVMRQAGKRASILVLGQAVGSAGRRELRTLLSCIEGVGAFLLVGEQARRTSGRVVALIDDPARSAEILAAAARFAGQGGEDVRVLVTQSAMVMGDELTLQLAELAGDERLIRLEPLRSDEPALVAHGVRRLGGGLLVAGFGGRMIADEIAVAQITTTLDCPLLLLRGRARAADAA